MTDDAALFDFERARLTSLAYRMTGTPDDADDVLQEVWLRWDRANRAAIDNVPAWLTTVTTRVAIDHLTSARACRERYVGPWLPEPATESTVDPAEIVAMTDSLTLGFMHVLETLQPVERAVFLLHDVFRGIRFKRLLRRLGRAEPATRQIAKRARQHVRDGRPRVAPRESDLRELSDAFISAVMEGDIERLATMLTADVVHISDGGADYHAARRPVIGPDRVARLMVNIARREILPTDGIHEVSVNGQRGLYVVRDGEPLALTVLSWRDNQVAEAIAIVNPDKLHHFHREWIEQQPSSGH